MTDRYDRLDPKEQWRTDFELGFVPLASSGPAANAQPAQNRGGNP